MAELEKRILRLYRDGTGVLKIGKTLGIGTALVQRLVVEQPCPFDVDARRAPLSEAERPLVAFFSKQDDMMNDDEREHRLRWFRALEERGLVVRREPPNGSAELYFPQPDHPDVLSFHAAKTLH